MPRRPPLLTTTTFRFYGPCFTITYLACCGLESTLEAGPIGRHATDRTLRSHKFSEHRNRTPSFSFNDNICILEYLDTVFT
jgi:hypothetical protein